ncbi:MAG TPA: RHS repeat-associated core domain-containing protein, partial [Burkholderiales bacterium]|nr:RHS repeat-associated core domain-containing protein [Burkholderiales bacterium]
VWLNDQPVGLIDYDLDQDGVPDALDNCITVANPSQWDADGDGIGEICSGDLNGDAVVTLADLQLLTKAVQGLVPALPKYDLNGDGVVNATDLALLQQRMGLTPGPSGLKGQAPGPRLYFVYADQQNSPRSVVNAQGVEVWRWDSADPFAGNGPNQDPDGDHMPLVINLRLPGQYFDRETGLNYNLLRDFDPSTGRYVQPSSLGLRSGINLYSYAGDNPVK